MLRTELVVGGVVTYLLLDNAGNAQSEPEATGSARVGDYAGKLVMLPFY